MSGSSADDSEFRPYKMVIFDWDGTLMDSLPKIVHSMVEAAKQQGLQALAEKDVHEIIGLELGEAISVLYPELSSERVEEMRGYYSNHYIQAEQIQSGLYPGVERMLSQLHNRSILSIATGKSRRGLDRVVDALDVGHYFASSRCADETRPKPNPDMVTELLDMHRLSPEQAVVIGDTEFDMEMARRAGVDRVGVSWGAHHIDRLKRHDPQHCVDSVGALAEWLLERTLIA